MGAKEGRSGQSPAPNPTQKQLTLGLFYIFRFHIIHHLTKGFYCLAGNTNIIPSPPAPAPFLTIEETGSWKAEVNQGFLILSSIIFSLNQAGGWDRGGTGFLLPAKPGALVSRTWALPNGHRCKPWWLRGERSVTISSSHHPKALMSTSLHAVLEAAVSTLKSLLRP